MRNTGGHQQQRQGGNQERRHVQQHNQNQYQNYRTTPYSDSGRERLRHNEHGYDIYNPVSITIPITLSIMIGRVMRMMWIMGWTPKTVFIH